MSSEKLEEASKYPSTESDPTHLRFCCSDSCVRRIKSQNNFLVSRETGNPAPSTSDEKAFQIHNQKQSSTRRYSFRRQLSCNSAHSACTHYRDDRQALNSLALSHVRHPFTPTYHYPPENNSKVVDLKPRLSYFRE
jgi:hypothetical protein